jgi:predicted RNA-binding Zn-ribbon protein involved in translation (DUF1610 family)
MTIKGRYYDTVKMDDVVSAPDDFDTSAVKKYFVNHWLTSSAVWFSTPWRSKRSDEKLMGWWCPACGDLLIDTNRKLRRKHERQCGVKLDHVEL